MKRTVSRLIHLLRGFAPIILAGIIVLCTGCASAIDNGAYPSPASSATPTSGVNGIPFQSLVQGYTTSSTQTKPALLMAQDSKGLDELAAFITRDQRSVLTNVDLEKNAVLAVFWGVKPSGGYSIAIDRVWIENDALLVNVILNEKDPALPKIDASTYPYHLVTIDRSALPPEMPLQYRLSNGDIVLAEGDLP